MSNNPIESELSNFFSLIRNEKRKQKEEIDSLVGDSFDKLFIEQLKPHKTPEQLAKKHKVPLSQIKNQLKKGTKVEKEHTKNIELATNIASQHIDELPYYYDRLPKVEKKQVKEEFNTEGLLNIIPQERTPDPLTPPSQNFATLDDLQKHYKLFLNRIQQQLSTLGGGGSSKIRDLDDVVGIATNSSYYDDKFLQWDSSTNTAKFVNINSVNITGIVTESYGNFFDTTTQAIVGVNTHQPVRLNTTDISNQVSIANSSHIVTAIAGIYNIQFSLRIDKTNGSGAHIYVWLRKNGLDVPNSAAELAVQGTSSEIVAAWNFLVSSNENDYYELIISSTDINIQLKAVSANGVVPAIPSVTVSVVLVADSNPLGIGITNTSNIILTTNEYDVPVWADNIDGGTF